MFNFNKIKVFSIITAVFLLTPMLVSAGVYFMESIDEDAKEIAVTKPCILDYPKRSCPAGKVPQRLCPSDKRFFQDCGCDTDVYKYDASSCTDNKTPSGTTCDGKFAGCACDTTKYKYDSTNCTGGKTLSGNTCDGKYDTCGCPAEYSKTCPSPMIGGETACDGKYKSCKCPASYVTCDNGGDVGASQCTEENGTVKWSSCKAATCVDGGFQSSVPVNQTCTQVPYNSLTCYENCRALTCEDGGYQSATNGATCTSVTYGGKTCYKDCVTKLTCQQWVQANHADKYANTYFTNQNATITLYTGQPQFDIYGPKYYSYDECQKMATPTVTLGDLRIDNKQIVKLNYINIHATSGIYIYYGRLEIDKNSKASTNELTVNQAGYTPTYYATTGAHVYGELVASSALFHAGQANIYSGGKFTATSWNVAANSSWPGRVRYDSGAMISVSGTCKKASSDGEYKIQSKITSNPVSGSGC